VCFSVFVILCIFLSVVCYFVWCVLLCVYVVPLPPGTNPFADNNRYLYKYILMLVLYNFFGFLMETKLLRNSVLSAFAKLRNVTVIFVMSVCLSLSLFVRASVRMKELGSHWTNFHKIWYLSIFRKPLQEIRVLLKHDKNNCCFTRRSMYVCNNVSLNSSRNKKYFGQNF
jgi:hypothetical protein